MLYISLTAQIFHEFIERKTRGQEPFVMPYISIPELGKHISTMDNKKSSGSDGINNHLLKFSLPYIIDSLTYIFNLCIEKKNISHLSLRKQKCHKLAARQIWLTTDRYHCYLSCPNSSKSMCMCSYMINWREKQNQNYTFTPSNLVFDVNTLAVPP